MFKPKRSVRKAPRHDMNLRDAATTRKRPARLRGASI